MKYFKLLTFVLILASTMCHGQNSDTTKTSDQPSIKIEVIDFHGVRRCVTCEAIELHAEYTVNKYFSEEKKNGTIVFKTVDVDKEENYDMAEFFEVSGTALFLNVIKGTTETHIDLTSFAFLKGKNKEVFATELKSKIEKEFNKQ